MVELGFTGHPIQKDGPAPLGLPSKERRRPEEATSMAERLVAFWPYRSSRTEPQVRYDWTTGPSKPTLT